MGGCQDAPSYNKKMRKEIDDMMIYSTSGSSEVVEELRALLCKDQHPTAYQVKSCLLSSAASSASCELKVHNELNLGELIVHDGQVGYNHVSKLPDAIGGSKDSQAVFIWDLDETLIIFQTLSSGKYAQIFEGSKNAKMGSKLGWRWEKLILEVCDQYFFYEQVEDFNEPNIDSLKEHDDGIDLSTYNFASDGINPCDDFKKRKLAYRHRRIKELYCQDPRDFLSTEQLQEWEDLYTATDCYTDGWLSAGRSILDSCRKVGNINALVTSCTLVPSLVKCLLFRISTYIDSSNVYSSREIGKLECFNRIKECFKTNSRFCVIGDGLDECQAAEYLKWPFVRVEHKPKSEGYLPALSMETLNQYMRVIYG